MRSYLYSLLLLPGIALGQITSPAPEAVGVTIYRYNVGDTANLADMNAVDGLALITETRTIDIPAGMSTIKFLGVAETIVPQSAKLESLPGVIIESNFDYSLIAPGDLIANSIGSSVHIIRTDKDTGKVTEQRATLLSGPSGVMLDIDGRIEALNCSGASERIVFDRVPASLSAEPTLSVTVLAAQPGKYRTRLSYLAAGLDWSADYIATIHPDGRKLDLHGWVTLANKQATTFSAANLQVIAGNVSILWDETIAKEIATTAVESKCWPIGNFNRRLPRPLPTPALYRAEAMLRASANPQDAAMPVEVIAGEIGDYKLYTIPFVTTVAARQVKQVQLFEQRGVAFERIYTYEVNDSTLNVDSISTPRINLRLQNKKSDGLGKAMPAGTFAVMEPEARGHLVLAGEQAVDDIPVGLPINVELGAAMDIAVKPRIVREYQVDVQGSSTATKNTVRSDIEIELANNKPVAITIELRQAETQPDFRIVSASKRHTLQQGAPMWALTMKAGERLTLRYTFEHTKQR